MEYKGYKLEAYQFKPGRFKVGVFRDYGTWLRGEEPLHIADNAELAKRWVDDEFTHDIGKRPKWTVVTNILSPESDKWIGTCWEFFDEESQAEACYTRQIGAGNTPTKRPYYENTDREHLGAAHRRTW